MNRTRIIGICILIVSLLFPSIVFVVKDYYDFHQNVQWKDTSLEHEIKAQHPIIDEIYDQYYNSETHLKDYLDVYSIKRNDEYDLEKQEKFQKVQNIFEQEIKKFIDQEMIPYECFEIEQPEDFKLDFGTIKDDGDDEGKYELDIIYRINTDNDNSIRFVYSKKISLITSFSIRNIDVYDLSQYDVQDMLEKYIKYLGLDDINDWKWTSFGFESYKAKLQLSYTFYDFEEKGSNLSVKVQPYGTYVNLSQSNFNIHE